jgi:hypothetical protein
MNVPLLAFNKGELSPKIDCRSDTEAYSSGCRRLENMIPSKYGCAERRPGTEMIDEATGALAIMVPFIYSSTVAYVLEFSDQLIRVYYDGEVLVDGSNNEVTVATDYVEADLRGLQFYQIADTMWIVHNEYPQAKLTRTSEFVFAINDIVFKKGPFLTRNDLIDPDVYDTALMVCDTTEVGDTGTLTCISNYVLTINATPAPNAFAVGAILTGGTSDVTCEFLIVNSPTEYIVTEPTDAFTDGEDLTDELGNTIDCAAGYPTVTENAISFFEAGHIGALFQLTHPKGTLNVNDTVSSSTFIGNATGTELIGDYTFRVIKLHAGSSVRLEKSDNAFTGHITGDFTSYDSNYVLVKTLTTRIRYNGTESDAGWFYRMRVIYSGDTPAQAQLSANTNTISGKLLTTNTGIIKYPIDIKGKFRYTTHGNWDGTFVLERNENGAGWEPYRTTVSAIVSGMGTRNVQESLIEESENVQYRMNVPIHNSGTIYTDISSEENVTLGIVRITAINSVSEAAIEVVGAVGSTEPTRRWSEGAWSGIRGYPSTVTFYKGRCVYGGMIDVPEQVTY